MSNKTEDSLQKALDIINKDIKKIDKLSISKTTLDRTEASKITDYVKTLITVQKEQREQERLENLSAKSDKDLEQLAKEALDFLEDTKKNKATPKKKIAKTTKETDKDASTRRDPPPT